MSISSLQSSINRIQNDLADLQKKISAEKKKEADATAKVNKAQQDLSKTNSSSTMRNKLSEINRCQDDISRASKNQAVLQKKVADKNKDLLRYQEQLSREQENERKKQLEAQKKIEREQLNFQKNLTHELEAQRKLIQGIQIPLPASPSTSETDNEDPRYDVFISHASEDKDEFVRPLAEELVRIGVKVWYDEFSMQWGDSLRRSIDRGLANSKYGVIVISSSFISKKWPAYELDGLIAREIEGGKVVLPIWHKVTKSEVMKYSPTLADKIAMNSSIDELSDIAKQLKEML